MEKAFISVILLLSCINGSPAVNVNHTHSNQVGLPRMVACKLTTSVRNSSANCNTILITRFPFS